MLGNLLRVLIVYLVVVLVLTAAAFADDRPAGRAIQEEVSAIPVTLPTIAYPLVECRQRDGSER